MTSARETALRLSFLDAGLASKRSGSGLNGCAHQTQFLSPLPLCVFPPASGSPRLRRLSRRALNLHERLLPWGQSTRGESDDHDHRTPKLSQGRKCCRSIDGRACRNTSVAQGNLQAAAKAMPYQAKPMPFDPKTITGISEKVLTSHYENNYVGAVKRLNAIGTQLSELISPRLRISSSTD